MLSCCGAGLAGLCAAYELQNLGRQVTVLEAQLRPGGRVRTLRESFAPGLYCEAGAEAIPSVHDLTLHYARAFNLNLLPNAVAGTRSFYHVRGHRIVPDDQTVWPFELTNEERQLGLAGLPAQVHRSGGRPGAGGRLQRAPRSLPRRWDLLPPEPGCGRKAHPPAPRSCWPWASARNSAPPRHSCSIG